MGMIKYVELKIGENQRFEDEFGNFFVVKRDKKGYYICDDSSYVYGPYERVIADLQIKDVFACGQNEKAFEFFNVGIDGLVSKEYSEISTTLKRELKELQIREELAFFPNCRFVGEVDVYRLEKIPNGPFAKKDGYTRIWLEGKVRNIFITKEGKYFAVNPNKDLKEFDKYRKFDTFEELSMYVNTKGFEYGSLAKSQNKNLAKLFHSLKFNRAIPNRYIKKVFDALKQKFGLEEFQNLKEEVILKVEKHKLVDLEDVYQTLLIKDLEDLSQFIMKNSSQSSNVQVPYYGVQEIQSVIDGLSSTLVYKQIDLTYARKKTTVFMSKDEEIGKKVKNKKLYDWHGMHQCSIDKPDFYQKICDLENQRVKEASFNIEQINLQSDRVLLDPFIYGYDEGENEND